MATPNDKTSPPDDEWALGSEYDELFDPIDLPEFDMPSELDVVSPINWNLLDRTDAEAEWRDLDRWVKFLKETYGLPPTVLPPLWHRHDELIWELSALHTHWRNSYHPDASGSAPLAWHRDFAEARNRLRDWVSTCGTRLDRDRPTRRTVWPGEPVATPQGETQIIDRDADFEAYVAADLATRRA
ncbi:hypothetical protein NBCG_01619 [Nocardioidaceae bacterium Broad-1]|nr:hypothetical protein NBCG_01619 [Nocardioidaceae bacterium Broad-1]